MLSSLFLIVVFVLAVRWFAPQAALTTAAGIPCVIFAGLFAMTFFEPAGQLATISTGLFSLLRPEPDFSFFMLLFLGALAAQLQLLALFPKPPRLRHPIEFRASLALTCMASYLVMAITLTACDTSPRLQKLLGLSPDRSALLGFIAPDAQWLSLVGLIADGSLSRPKRPAPPPTLDEPAIVVSMVDQSRTLRHRFIEHPAHPVIPSVAPEAAPAAHAKPIPATAKSQQPVAPGPNLKPTPKPLPVLIEASDPAPTSQDVPDVTPSKAESPAPAPKSKVKTPAAEPTKPIPF